MDCEKPEHLGRIGQYRVDVAEGKVAKQKTKAALTAGSPALRMGWDSNWMAIADSLEDELLVIDRNHRILAVNATVLKRHGLTMDKVIGRLCFEVSHGLPAQCQPPRLECPINALWETGNAARVTHAHVYEHDGKIRRRYLDIIVSPIRNAAGEVVAATELMRDVTETKLLEMRIAALGAITSAVSHSLDLDTVLDNALPRTLEMTHAKVGAILLADEEKKTLSQENIGSFTQYPIKLSWAITIHKSQGKTFDRVIIDLERGSFAHGQTYVAISRCTTLEGLYLKKPLKKNHIIRDYKVAQFLTQYQYDISDKILSYDQKVAIIEKAILSKQPLNIVYLKPNDQKTTRTIVPQHMGDMKYNNKQYFGVEAYCQKRKEMRTFKVDRILNIT